MSLQQALSELRSCAGSQFDLDCVAALESVLAPAEAA
jgi:HD-GYP domain-containing protein (c-di-GMP phosphodiesterase class II)